MIRLAGRLAGAFAVAYAGICALMYFSQDGLLYYPVPEVQSDAAEDLRLSHDGETLQIWKLGDGRRAVIYFGGNAENVAGNIPRFSGAFEDAAVYLVNYRGYGGSTGEPGERALYEDAVLVFDQVAERHDAIAAIGRSLGSGVAVWLAANRPVSSLVLVTPFDSIEQVARQAYPFLPVSLLIRDRYAAIDHAADIDVPVLILAARNDAIIPNSNTLALADAIDSRLVRLRIIDGVTHNSISRSPAYLEEISAFIDRMDAKR